VATLKLQHSRKIHTKFDLLNLKGTDKFEKRKHRWQANILIITTDTAHDTANWMHLQSSGLGPTVGCCERGNEPLESINSGKIFGQLICY
jgi:hypothetical protein